MNNQNLAIKIKDLRNRKAFSQEQLAEESNLSLRTIQRIEKGESIPRGDTLVKLTQALGVTPDDLLEWEIIEDKGYVQLLNWSAISFIIQPLLGIIIPLVMWIFKRGKVKFVDETGKKIINFQITWVLILNIFSIIVTKSSIMPLYFNILDSMFLIFSKFSIALLILLLLYLFNIVCILINVKKSQKGLKNKYFPAIPFLK
jgi:transcriptional regulator with XRE-family HTH domain